MPLSKDRRKMVNAPSTPEEIRNFRALIGQMGWVTRQTRPDLMVNVSVAAQSMSSPKIKDVINLNKAVKMLKESADATWRLVFTPELKLEDVVVCAVKLQLHFLQFNPHFCLAMSEISVCSSPRLVAEILIAGPKSAR